MDEINKIEGFSSVIEKDESGREIYRLKISVIREKLNMSAEEVIKYLKNGDPSIFTRNHYSNIGIIYIDPRPLNEGEEKIILNRFIGIGKIGKEGKK